MTGAKGEKGENLIVPGYELLNFKELTSSVLYSHQSSSTTLAEGTFYYNNENLQSVTLITISKTNLNNVVIADWVDSLEIGGQIKLLDAVTGTDYTLFEINSITHYDTYYEFGVSYLSSSINGSPTNNFTYGTNIQIHKLPSLFCNNIGDKGLKGYQGEKGASPNSTEGEKGYPGEKGGIILPSSSRFSLYFGDYISNPAYNLQLENAAHLQFLATPNIKKQICQNSDLIDVDSNLTLFTRSDGTSSAKLSLGSHEVTSLDYSFISAIACYPQYDWSYYFNIKLRQLTLALVQDTPGLDIVNDSLSTQKLSIQILILHKAGDRNQNSQGSFEDFQLTDKEIQLNQVEDRLITKNRIYARSEWITLSSKYQVVDLSNITMYKLDSPESIVNKNGYIWTKKTDILAENVFPLDMTVSLIYNFGQPEYLSGSDYLENYQRVYWTSGPSQISFKSISLTLDLEYISS